MRKAVPDAETVEAISAVIDEGRYESKKTIKPVCGIAAVLLLAAAIPAFLPRNANGGGETALDAAENAGERLPNSETDCERELAEAVFGKLAETTDAERADVEAELLSIGALCGEIYLHAEKIPSAYDDRGNVSQPDIDAMEAAISSADYCVTNSDAVYPKYLENPESLRCFWDEATNGNDAAAI